MQPEQGIRLTRVGSVFEPPGTSCSVAQGTCQSLSEYQGDATFCRTSFVQQPHYCANRYSSHGNINTLPNITCIFCKLPEDK